MKLGEKTLLRKAQQAVLARMMAEHMKNPKGDYLTLCKLLRLENKPYTLRDHQTFEPFFTMRVPRRLLLKCCRQVGKTKNGCGSRLLRSWMIPNYKILCVSPRFEQAKRVSQTEMHPFITRSPVKHLWTDPSLPMSVATKEFTNGSNMDFSYAFLDCDRIRGYAKNEIWIDEVQDMNWDFIPVIEEVMSGQKIYRNRLFTGTPKGMDNTIQRLWEDSSQGILVIQCPSCGYWNHGFQHGAEKDLHDPSYGDLWDMIGDKGPRCAKCWRYKSKEILIDPRGAAEWAHMQYEKRGEFTSYHISQPVHPVHYESEENWAELLHKKRNYPISKFFNECLGESFDAADKLMTLSALRALTADSPFVNGLREAIQNRKQLTFCAMGIDWGGGGDGESYTSVAIGGTRPGSDRVNIVYVYRLPRTAQIYELYASIVILYRQFMPDVVSHDYTGAGALAEKGLIDAGVPDNRIFGYTYQFMPEKPVILYKPNKNVASYRDSYTIDKGRSLVILCIMIRSGKVVLPRYNSCVDEANPGEYNMLHDFTHLIEERLERPGASDVSRVVRAAGKPDDVAHAINFVASTVWYMNQGYPEFMQAVALEQASKQSTAARMANTEALAEDPNLSKKLSPGKEDSGGIGWQDHKKERDE